MIRSESKLTSTKGLNMKRIIKTTNLFEFAENRLIARVKKGDIGSYSVADIIDNAVKVRKYLDKHKKLIIPKMSILERKQKNLKYRQRYYFKTGK
jgi:hypothetical protein